MPGKPEKKYHAVVIGASAGGVVAVKTLLQALPEKFPLPILIVQHISPETGRGMEQLLRKFAALSVKEADEQDEIKPGTVYLAPPNYHLLVEPDLTVSLSAEEPVSYARPSIDLLFESAAIAYGPALIGVILTGANMDGRNGLKTIKEMGGLAIIQDPSDAEIDSMPLAALAAVKPDYIVKLADLAGLLIKLAGVQENRDVCI